MEMLEKGKYVINTEQNINVDKTFLKFSIKDIMMFSEVMDVISKDMQKFDIETSKHLTIITIGGEDKGVNRGSSFVAEINRDLEINRRTEFRPKEEVKIGDISIDKSKAGREMTAKRMVSDISNRFENTLTNNIIKHKRKQTEDNDIRDRTGSFANPDEDAYQSRVRFISDATQEFVRKGE